MKLSILDQVPISKGMTSTEALANSVKLAQLGDEIGYERMWLAEHHNMTTIASSAPEVTAAYLAAKTDRIRLGTGGIMMMHYSPLKVAEVFKTLASGRRPEMTEQYDKLEIILRLMNEQRTGEAIYDNVVATPFKVQLPQAWLLGSSGQSAKQAGVAGVGYSFAQFFNGQMSKAIFDAYRNAFQPSYFMAKPEIITTYAVSVAETSEEAEYLSMPMQISRLNLMRGKTENILSPKEANDYPLTEMDKMLLEQNRPLMLIGSAEEVANQILEEQAYFGFDEAMINCNLFSIEQRLNSYRLLGEQLALKK